MREALFVVFLQLVGLATLAGLKPRLPWSFTLASSFLVGLSIFTLACWVLFVSPISVSLEAVLGVLAAFCAVPLILCKPWTRLSGWEVTAGAGACAVGAWVSAVSQWFNPAILSIDSWWLLEHAAVLAATGSLNDLEPERLLAYPVLVVFTQFPAGEFGLYYLISIFVMSALSGLACLGWYAAHGASLVGANGPLRMGLAVSALAFTATTYFVVWQIFYVNGHLIFAGLFLILCASLWIAVMTREWEWVAPAALTIPPLLLARLEAPLVLSLALLPFIASKGPPDRIKAAIIVPFVLVGTVWYGWVLGGRGDGAILSESSATVMSVVVAAVGVLLLVQRVEAMRPIMRRVPAVAFAGMLAVTLAMVATRPEHMVESIVTLTTNAVQQGLWGPFWVVLVPVLLLVAGARALPWESILLLPIGGFFMIVLQLVYFRDETYRLRWGDSGNRMLTHVCLLAVLYVVVKCASLLAKREPKERGVRWVV